MSDPQKLWTLDELAARWRLKPRMLIERIRSRNIPYIDFGDPAAKIVKWSCVRFRIEDIEAFEAGGRSTAPPMPTAPESKPDGSKRKGRKSLLWS